MKSRNVVVALGGMTFAVAVAAMSLRSQGTKDEYRRVTCGNAYLYLLSESGELAVKITPAYPVEPPDATDDVDWMWCREYEQRGELFAGECTSYGVAGLDLQVGDDVLFDYLGSSVPCRGFAVVIPYRMMVLAAAVLPALGILRHARRRYRRAKSLCVQCGYDLRASSSRCPECGQPFTPVTRRSYPARAIASSADDIRPASRAADDPGSNDSSQNGLSHFSA